MKIAIVHDQLQEFGGAERVLVSLKKIYPQADVFTSFYNPDTLGVHAKEFKDFFIIEPEFNWWDSNNHNDGKSLKDGFMYSSDNNPKWLTKSEMKKLAGL